uniref:Ubiquitin-like-conjugating enzyme ATG10 n=1 Tax=Dugesia japonica TaxID=6161 RepID=A0A2S1BJI6_DUGJA|nr:Atg10 [Dugesia japonica]
MNIDRYFKEINEFYHDLKVDRTKIWYTVQHNSCKSSFEIYTKSCLQNSKCEEFELCKIEYRIGYSVSFAAPILYIRAENENGNSFGYDQFKSLLIQFSFDSEYFKYLVQVEHPFLGLPYFSMHPCQTNEALNQLTKALPLSFEGRQNSVKLWALLFGNLFRLGIS